MVFINNSINDFTNFDFKTLSSILKSIPPLEFGLLGGVIGVIISAPLNSAELNSLGNFLQLISQVMLTIQAQIELVTPSYPLREELATLQNEINEKFNYLYNLIQKNK